MLWAPEGRREGWSRKARWLTWGGWGKITALLETGSQGWAAGDHQSNQLGYGGRRTQESQTKVLIKVSGKHFKARSCLPYLLLEGVLTCPSAEKPLPPMEGSPFLLFMDPCVNKCVGSRGSGFYPCVSLTIAALAPSTDLAGAASGFQGYQTHTMLWAGEKWTSFFLLQPCGLWECFWEDLTSRPDNKEWTTSLNMNLYIYIAL